MKIKRWLKPADGFQRNISDYLAPKAGGGDIDLSKKLLSTADKEGKVGGTAVRMMDVAPATSDGNASCIECTTQIPGLILVWLHGISLSSTILFYWCILYRCCGDVGNLSHYLSYRLCSSLYYGSIFSLSSLSIVAAAVHLYLISSVISALWWGLHSAPQTEGFFKFINVSFSSDPWSCLQSSYVRNSFLILVLHFCLLYLSLIIICSSDKIPSKSH